MSQKTTKRVFTRKSKLFLVLASMILALSCKNPLGDESGGSGSGGAGGGGSGGGQTITNEQGKVFPAWYLTAEEQGKDFEISKTLFFSTVTPQQHYRIPAIIAADNGNIVAICDNRHTKFGDIGQINLSDFIDIVYKVSKDGGYTWSDEKIILPKTTENKLTTANNKGDPIVFKHTDGTLVCFAVSGGGYAGATDKPETRSRILRSESRNHGETWSNWEEVGQNLIDEIKNKHGKYQAFLSSGRGLTLKDGTFAAAMAGPNFSVIYVYSRDKGKTWHYGQYINGKNGSEYTTITEPKVIAELEDGKLLMSVRNSTSIKTLNNPRLYAVSTAAGYSTSWPATFSKWNFLDGGVDSEGVVWTRKSLHDKNRMIHIQAQGIQGTDRRGLKLYLSEDEGRTASWKEVKAILPSSDRACYASIDILGDGTVITFAEEPTRATGTDVRQYDLVFRRYNLFALTKEVYKTEWYKEIK